MNLRRDAIAPLILRLALPASLGMLFSVMLNVVDTWYAGKLSATAVAALSLAAPVFFLVMTLGIGIGQATNALVGNRLGADEPHEARRLAMQAIAFAIIVSVLGALLAYLVLPTLFRAIGGEDPYLEPARRYTSVVLLGVVFFSLALVINAILNTRGDTHSYRNAQFIALLANVVLDPFFIFVLDLGVVGIAVATVLVQAGVVTYLMRRALHLDFMKGAAWSDLLPQLHPFRDIATQSLPNSVSMLLVAIGSLIIVRYVTPFGESAMAAYGIALRIEQLVLLPVIGINIACLSMTGVNYGAHQLDRVRATYRTGLAFALVLMIAGGAVLLLAAEPLMQLFIDDTDVQRIGRTYLVFEAFILPAYGLIFLSGATLQGLKKPVLPMAFNVFRQVIGQLSLFHLAVYVLHTDITGVWWSVLLVNWLSAIGLVLTALAVLRRLDTADMPRGGRAATDSVVGGSTSGNRTAT